MRTLLIPFVSTLVWAHTALGGGCPTSYTNEMIRMVNEIRSSGTTCGGTWYGPTGPVDKSGFLKTAAARHARDMAMNNNYNHTGTDGSDVGRRIRDTGYLDGANGWSAAENIDASRQSARAAFESWKGSPGHCSAMMNPRFEDIGIACHYHPGSQWKYYWAMELGYRNGGPVDLIFGGCSMVYQIANQSGQPVRYTLGNQTFRLDHNKRRDHRLTIETSGCRTPVWYQRNSNHKYFTISNSNTRYEFRSYDGGYRLYADGEMVH